METVTISVLAEDVELIRSIGAGKLGRGVRAALDYWQERNGPLPPWDGPRQAQGMRPGDFGCSVHLGVMLPPDRRQFAFALGKGSLAAGVRAALDYYRTEHAMPVPARPEPRPDLEPVSVNLAIADRELAAQIGRGNVSAGVRAALAAWRETRADSVPASTSTAVYTERSTQ